MRTSMSYLHCEATAWVDPYLIRRAADEHLLDDDDDEQRAIKKKLTDMVKRRDACSIPRDPKTDKVSVVSPQYVAHPVEFSGPQDRHAPQYFTHVAVSNNTFVGITKNNMIHFFDQTNDIPITSVTMVGHTPLDERSMSLQQKLASAAVGGAAGVLNHIQGGAHGALNPNYVDAKDVVVKLLLDPMGRYAVVVFQSGVQLLYHIKRADAETNAQEDDETEKEKKKKKKKEKKNKKKKAHDSKDKPQRFDISLTADVTGGVAGFCIESIAWDEHNAYESGSGDAILGSQKNGVLVACRFESSGVAGARHLFTFPAPFNKQPIHGVAMTREQDGQKRSCILVAMDHKLFFFRSTRSTLESAFVLSDLSIPDSDAEMAFLAASGSSSGGALPLKNFWALPSSLQPMPPSAPSNTTPSKHHVSSATPAVDNLLPAVSRVFIHSPHRSYSDEQLPLTFTWTYYDTVVQGVLVPFPKTTARQTEGTSTGRGSAAAAISNRRKDHCRSQQAADASTDLLQLMRDSMRIVHVESCASLVAAAEYALQFDTESSAPPFNAPPPTVASASSPAPAATPMGRSYSVFGSPHSATARSGSSNMLQSPTAQPTNMVYALQSEKVVRVFATYFYLTIVTQTRMYVFASLPCAPLPSPASPWEVRNRLLYSHALTASPAPPTTVVLQPQYGPAASKDPGNSSGTVKLPALLYKSPDGCVDVVRDAKYINKLYLCLSKEIVEIALPSLKRAFVVLLIQNAMAIGQSKGYSIPSPVALTISQHHFPEGGTTVDPSVREGEGAGLQRGGLPCALIDSTALGKHASINMFSFLPFVETSGVSEDDVTGAATGRQVQSRDRSTTIASRPALRPSSKPLASGSKGPSSLYTNVHAMRLYAASRFPVRPGTRTHVLPTDVLFQMALSLSSKQPKLRKTVENAFGELLFAQERFLEAAAWLGKYSTQGADEWFARFAAQCSGSQNNVQPLLLFCLVRTRVITESGNSMFGPGAVAVSCLSAAALVLLLDRCNAAQDSTNPAPQRECTTLRHALEAHHHLNNPVELLAELLKAQKDLLPWSVVQEALFRVGSVDQVFTVCRTMDRLQELLQYLLSHGRYFDAMQLVIERSQREAQEFLCYDDEGYVHPGIGAHLWQSYGGVFIKHFPVRMIKQGWVAHGASIGIDPLRLLPILARYHPRNNETNFEATASAEEVRAVLREQDRRRQQHNSRGEPPSAEATSVAASTEVLEGVLESDTKSCTEHVGITYLRHLIREGYTEQAISNLLLSFLATSGSDDELKEFVLNDKTLDLQFALRVCHRQDRPVAVVYITFALGHLHEAIRMALDHGEVSRAKALVELVHDGTAGTKEQGAAMVRQELWKMIVKHVATQQFGPKNALLLINESKNDVNVSHVIPHLSDDVMLSEFKTELLENVSDFGRLMKEVREGIERSKADVELLRGDLTDALRGAVKVNTAKRCDHCQGSIWSSGRGDAVVFRGCAHAFHQACLRERWASVELTKRPAVRIGMMNDDDEDGGSKNTHVETCFLCSPIALRHLLTEPIGLATSSLSTLSK